MPKGLLPAAPGRLMYNAIPCRSMIRLGTAACGTRRRRRANIKGMLLVVATCSHLYRRQTPYLKPFIVRRRWHPTPEEVNTKGLLLVTHCLRGS